MRNLESLGKTTDQNLGGKRGYYRNFIYVTFISKETGSEDSGLMSWNSFHALEKDRGYEIMRASGWKREHQWEDEFEAIEAYGSGFTRPKVILAWPV